MTLVRTATIPSEFVRFDATMTDADAFNNVRDMQVARENLNILLARRIRHPLLAVRFRRTGYVATEGQYIYGYGPLAAGSVQPGAYMLGPWRIWTPPCCKSLTLRLRASMSTADGDAMLYPCLMGWTMPNTAYEIVVTGTALDEYELDIPLPSNYSGMARSFDLAIFYTCESYGADLKGGGHNVVAWAEEKMVVTATGAVSSAGTALLYFVSPANTIEPQRITDAGSMTVGGSTYYWAKVARPWNRLPAAGDTFNSRALAAFIPLTLTVFPKAITDFGTVAGLT